MKIRLADYVADFLVDNGIIDELKRLGCKEGDTVRLYGHGFEFFD